MMDECDVNITIPPSRDESDQVTILGTRTKVNRAIQALQQKVAEIEAENEDRVGFLFSLRPFHLRSSNRVRIVKGKAPHRLCHKFTASTSRQSW